MKNITSSKWTKGGTRFVMLIALCAFSLLPARGAWREQAFTLKPGWNAVWLEVTPELREPASVFSGLPVRTVLRHYNETASPRFVSDDASVQGLKLDPENWLSWSPGEPASQVVQSLQAIHGGAAYLIEITGSADVAWAVRGRPVVEELAWLNAAHSLTGLAVDPALSVTFDQFFAGSAAHANADIRGLQADGTWVTIPRTTAIQRGAAYWIQSNGISSFQGRGHVLVDNKGLLDYGSSIIEHQVVLVNTTNSGASFTLTVESAAPPAGVTLAGPVELDMWRDGSSGSTGWVRLGTSATAVVVPAATSKVVRLAVARRAMGGLGADVPFGSVLRVAGLNACHFIGIAADGMSTARFAGLWAGQCVLRSVNEPNSATPTDLQPTASEASLRLLLRVAADGKAELLREATIFWIDGITDSDGDIVEAGRFVVAASDTEVEALINQYGVPGSSGGRLKGATVRNGRSVPRRLSSVGFSFNGPQVLTGTFDPAGGTLSADLVIGYDDDLNPYKHRYHPDHDNLDSRYTATTADDPPEGTENYTIKRAVSLTFQSSPPENGNLAGFGDSVVGGTYGETISGLHEDPVQVGGTFILTRVAAGP